MKRLNISVQIDPQFTADDWQLYTSTMDCTDVANQLNTKLKELVNENIKTRGCIEDEMYKLMNKLASFGAADWEPFHFFKQILDKCFGDNNE